MTDKLSVRSNRWHDLGKIFLTALLYYSTSRLGDIFTFIHSSTHETFQAFWAPSGIAFGMIILFGRSVWPGILIASLIRTPLFSANIGTNAEIVSTALVSLTVAAGRVIEPLVGYVLIQRFLKVNKSFNTLKNSLRFIAITLLISIIGSSISASIIQVFRQDSLEVYLSRISVWYSNNVFGILLFTPLLISIYQISTYETARKKTIAMEVAVLMAVMSLFFLIDIKLLFDHPILLRALYLFTIPILLWLAFQYHLAVSSLAVMLISIISVYFASEDVGPFVGDISITESALLLKLFLITASLSTILSSSASSERNAHVAQIEQRANELTYSNKILKKMTEDLEQAFIKAEESDRLKSSFLSNMSHEIRTPMNAIMGISELLERDDIPDERRKKLTRLIRERSENLLSIITGILLISELESNKKKPVLVNTDIAELFLELKNECAEKLKYEKEKNITMQYRIHLDADHHQVYLDALDLKLVLSHLLDNAMKFTHQGHIELSCSIQDKDVLLFKVTDTGIGIPTSKFDMIFRPFNYADDHIHLQHGGTGLGLAICKMVVSNWGGEISVESKKDEGSTFSFTLPLKKEYL